MTSAPGTTTGAGAAGEQSGGDPTPSGTPDGTALARSLTSRTPAGPTPSDVATTTSRVADAAAAAARAGGGRISVVVAPEGLGRIEVTVSLHRGVVRVHVSGEARALAALDAASLSGHLGRSGLTAEISTAPSAPGQQASSDPQRGPQDSPRDGTRPDPDGTDAGGRGGRGPDRDSDQGDDPGQPGRTPHDQPGFQAALDRARLPLA